MVEKGDKTSEIGPVGKAPLLLGKSLLVLLDRSLAQTREMFHCLLSVYSDDAFHVFHVICMRCDASFSIRTTFFMSCRLSCPKHKTHHHVKLKGPRPSPVLSTSTFAAYFSASYQRRVLSQVYLQTPQLDFWFTQFTHFSSLLRFYFKAKPVQNLKMWQNDTNGTWRCVWTCLPWHERQKPKPRLYNSHVGKQLTHYMIIVHTCSHWLDVKPFSPK